jgi:hypothetical protein
MTVDFLLILFLEAKQNLGGNNSCVRVFKMKIRIKRKSRGIFEKMCCDINFIDFAHHVVARLVYAKQSEAIQNSRVDFIPAVGNNADQHLNEKRQPTYLDSRYAYRTFSQAFGPQVWEFFLEQRCAMFRITPYSVRQKRNSSS